MLNRQPEVSLLPHQAASQGPGGEEEPQQLHDQEVPDDGQVQEARRGKPRNIRSPLQDYPRARDTERVQKQDWHFQRGIRHFGASR